jgi:hypothetical protein
MGNKKVNGTGSASIPNELEASRAKLGKQFLYC